MEHRTAARKPIPKCLLVGTALFIVLGLFFIDEGHYSLHGLFTVEHMLVLGIYLGGLFLGISGTARLFARRPAGVVRVALVVGLGSLVGLVLTMVLLAMVGAVAAWVF